MQVQQIFPYFADIDGEPLNSGYIYIGTANANPETSPISVYWDEAFTQPAAQPLRTINGFIVRNGTLAKVYTNSDFSITVRNKNSVLVSYFPNQTSFEVNLASSDGASLVGYDDTTVAGMFLSRIGRVVQSIAALKTLDKTKYTQAFVTGYYTPSDGGGGAYWYDSTDAVSLDNGGTIIVAADGGRWKLVVTGLISIKQFGAKGDLSQNDQPFIQACVTWAAGKNIFAPVGQYRMNTGVSSTGPINLFGEGNGCGPGPAAISNSGCTQFLLYSSSASHFSSTSNYPSSFKDFQLNVAVANRPMTSGIGIAISGPVGSTNANSKIENVGFTNCYTCISLNRTLTPTVKGCYFDSWVFTALSATTTAGIESGLGNIEGNNFYGTSGSTTQNSCILTEVGYGFIHANLFLGSSIGISIGVKNHDAGAIRIWGNSIENQGTYGIRAQSTDGSKASMILISHNEFSNVAYVTNWAASIATADYSAGTPWLDDLQIHDNVHRHTLSVNHRYIWIQSGRQVSIHDEQIENLGAGASTTGIDIFTFASTGLLGPVSVKDIQFLGTFALKYLITATTQIHDKQGLTFAELPAAAANGSTIYCSNGTFANPVAGAGTGCIAKRLNGVWRGD